ncbi:DUF5134 domain-containing protein [Streptomyces sp. NPDC047515]|uniref:DUF5134 domain-containing protein n=1 Tax=Streptomyces sp. NPDC047515 TaxID=3155380 RepID=UPI0033EC3B17
MPPPRGAVGSFVLPRGSSRAGTPESSRVKSVLLPGASTLPQGVVQQRPPVPHVVMTGAMAWTVAVMAASMSMGGSGTGGGHAGRDMPGMGMSGPGALGAMELSGASDRWSAGILALVLLAPALWWLARGFDTGRLAHRPDGCGVASDFARGALDLGFHGVMSPGMAVMFVVIAVRRRRGRE